MRHRPDGLENTVLITHKDCLDGAGCAVVFLLAGGRRKNVHYVPAGHGVKAFVKKNRHVLDEADRVIIADVSPDSSDGETPELFEKLGNVTLIDHHKSALHLSERSWCHLAMDKCGTRLLHDYLCPSSFDMTNPINQLGYKERLARLAYLINDHDMWIREDPMSDQLSMFMGFYGQARFVDMMELRIRRHALFLSNEDIDLIQMLESKRDEYVERHSREPVIREVDGVEYGYVFIDDEDRARTSLTLHRVLERHGCDVAVGVKLGGAVVSIRTTDRVDATVIAEAHGGGGHARAAGHSIDRKTMEEVLEVIHP